VEESIKENIFYRAKLFIEDIGYFSPFGAKMNGEKIIDVMAYKEFEETIEGVELIDLLKGSFSKDLKAHKIHAAGIAYDVIIEIKKSESIFKKSDALCLITSTDGTEWTSEYFPYRLIEGKCIWQ